MIAAMNPPSTSTLGRDGTMPKKSSPRQTEASRAAPRKQRMSIATIRAQIESCREALGEIDSVLALADAAGLEYIDVDGATMILRAEDELTRFSDKASIALRQAKRKSRSSDV